MIFVDASDYPTLRALGDKPAKKDHLAAVFQKQVLPELEPPLVEVDIVAIAVKERKPELPPDPITAIVANDRAGGRRADHAVNSKRPLAREDRGGDQDGLTGHRDAGAFHRDDEKNRQIAIGRDRPVQMLREVHIRETPWLR